MSVRPGQIFRYTEPRLSMVITKITRIPLSMVRIARYWPIRQEPGYSRGSELKRLLSDRAAIREIYWYPEDTRSVPPLTSLMLELNGCCAGFKMGEPPGPCQAELLCGRFFLPAGKLFDIVNRVLPEIRGEIVYHPVHGF